VPGRAAERFDPSQPREEDGRWANVAGAIAAVLQDTLRLAGRVDLDAGERLVASRRMTGPGRNDLVWAVTDSPAGRELRLGVVDHEDTPRWRAANLGGTARLDAAGISTLRRQLAAAAAAGRRHQAQWRRQVDQPGATFPEPDPLIAEGTVPGAPGWGQLAWQVNGVDDGEGGWSVDLAVRPPDAPAGWTVADAISEEREMSLDARQVRGVIGQLDRVAGVPAAEAWDPELHPRGPDGRFIRRGIVAALLGRASDAGRSAAGAARRAARAAAARLRVVADTDEARALMASLTLRGLQALADELGVEVVSRASRSELVEQLVRGVFARREAAAGDNALKRFWTKDPEGLARWATRSHPWTALYRQLVKHMPPARARRVASAWFREVFGIWPGERAGANPTGPG
jgi:hypothetical protein